MYLQLVTHINSNLKNYQFYKNFKDNLKNLFLKFFYCIIYLKPIFLKSTIKLFSKFSSVFLLITIFTIFIMFLLFIFSQDCSLPQILHLWLDYDFYLPNSETPPFSRQTVAVEQIKAPSVY